MAYDRRRAKPDREGLQIAWYTGIAKRLRGVLWTDRRSGSDPSRQARHRAEWPELWDTIDELIDRVDDDFPPGGSGRPSPI